MPLPVPFEDSTLRVVTDGHLVVLSWFDTPRAGHMRALTRVAEAHFQRLRGDKQVVVSIQIGGSPDFSEEMRRLTAEAGRRMAPWRAATAHVILFGGLRGLIARSITSTALLLSRSKAPTKVFDSVDAAASWILPHLPAEGWSVQRLVGVCAAARRPWVGQHG